MCFDHDARPPIEPIVGAALDSGSELLTSADGTVFRAFVARPVAPTGAGILILPDVRGLHPYYEELALRFAEHGVAAVAIDYFGRTGGTEPRGADFEYGPHVAACTWPTLETDIRAGVTRLRQETGITSTFTTGFCMGGRLTFVSAALGLGLAGVIGFYGWLTGASRQGTPAPADIADQFECDVLSIWGGADEGIPQAVVDTFDAALAAAGVAHRTIVAAGAPHSFFDRRAEAYAAASAEAWAATLGFIRERTAG